MASPYRIRPARFADAPAIAAIERATFSDPWPASAFASRGPGEMAWLAEGPPGTVLGFVVTRRVADEGEILDLAVRESARRAGVGTALLGVALADLGDAGVRRVFLEVRASNTAAQGFYRRHGFTAVGRRADYYRTPPEDAVLMERSVTPDTEGA